MKQLIKGLTTAGVEACLAGKGSKPFCWFIPYDDRKTRKLESKAAPPRQWSRWLLNSVEDRAD
jgi:hypothetical protein